MSVASCGREVGTAPGGRDGCESIRSFRQIIGSRKYAARSAATPSDPACCRRSPVAFPGGGRCSPPASTPAAPASRGSPGPHPRREAEKEEKEEAHHLRSIRAD